MMYDYADRAIRDMNRRNLRAFDRLKLIPADELNVLRAVTAVYNDSVELAKKRYKSIALEAYVFAAILAGLDEREARRRANTNITDAWIMVMLEDYDPVTQYRFTTEAERKKQRLIEAILSRQARNEAIDRALRLWTLQVGHYADRSVLDATIEAYRDAGVKYVRWVSVEDPKVCSVCSGRDGRVYRIDAIPPRPHYHCRCSLLPVR